MYDTIDDAIKTVEDFRIPKSELKRVHKKKSKASSKAHNDDLRSPKKTPYKRSTKRNRYEY